MTIDSSWMNWWTWSMKNCSVSFWAWKYSTGSKSFRYHSDSEKTVEKRQPQLHAVAVVGVVVAGALGFSGFVVAAVDAVAAVVVA